MRLFIVLIAVGAASALFDTSDDVVELTAANFNQKVINGDEVWLVEFYAPWCGHCKNLAPEWKKAATALKGVVKVGAVDMDVHSSVGAPYNVRGFPTIKVFGANKASPTDYNGARTATGIIESGLKTVKDMVNARSSGRGGGGRGSGGSGSGGSGSGGSGGKADDVVELTDGNFEKEVLNSKDGVLVEFFAPWCGHCKSLAPEWAKAATELKGKMKLGALDATVHTVTASRYNVRGYPTLRYFPAGVKDANSAEEYDGGRTATAIVAWALDKFSANIPPPEVMELIEQKVLTDSCDVKPLCIISVLPHILDSGAVGRKQYLQILKGMGEKYKKKDWGWVWTSAGEHSKLEESLGIGGFGYPAMAAVNTRKQKFSILKGSFSKEGIDEFMRTVSVGRGSSESIRGDALPGIETKEPWDGKDGEMPEEDDIDLSDFDMDDDDADEDVEVEKKDEL
ncbi:protein disulfide-isomerase A6 homolog [Strongylocentrotus purpuratus]|uniref:protein disulfide-isomerase n=1 Tax=Strongylocentrotus purpuratus TaxID=7668 RepID=A0A7M7N458_STRPU|nr:protein disulfide-isomerase A6 homolog [Strongylocentrotus purpuratus]